jgi:hypothetical protein
MVGEIGWERQGKFHGLAFDDGLGQVVASEVYEIVFHDVLREIQE